MNVAVTNLWKWFYKMTVYLVGSGPGDPGLLTLKAFELLQDCDVLIFDRLADKRIVNFANSESLKISAGKGPGSVDLTQEEINTKLVELSKEYKRIVRLKGGDPFVFGRGGEEAQVLIENNIDFEIVPGISSSIAGPAYAGIPVTHRGVSTNFTVVTGHEAPTKNEEQVRWKELALIDGTIIVLMGIANRDNIANALINGGKDKNTPVAIVRNATRPNQETIRCTLETLGTSDAKSPSVMVIGKVAGFDFSWFENKPLFGKSIVVTRSREQNSKIAKILEGYGANVIEAPVITLEKCNFEFPNLDESNYVIFTSTNGVQHTMSALFDEGKDVRYFSGVKICAVGKSTANELKKFGLIADMVPQTFNGAELAALFPIADATNSKVICFRAKKVKDTIEVALSEKGYQLVNIVTYENNIEKVDNSTIEKISNADLIAFSSSSTVTNALKIFGDKIVKNIKYKISIGPVTSATLRENEIEPDCEAQVSDVDGMVKAVLDMVKNAK